jgi:serine/threonine protein kinase
MTDSPHRVGETEAETPERLGAYRVEAPIGAGGMGKVYRALDEALNRPVALKVLLPSLAADPGFVARFRREAQSAAALNHPNITQIYAIGEEDTVPFFAMELVGGNSLESMVKKQGRLDPWKAAGYIVQAATGLRHAAQKGLIHRDIKPSNLMLAENGVVKITDFGLAKAARSETQITITGEVLGSPGFISPEQAQGASLDARSDIYSLGATFYQLVTGHLPFEAPTAVAMIIKHMNEPLRPPRALNPAIPYPLSAVIQRMMAKRPQERFQDYDALIRELERAVSTTQPTAGALTAAAGSTVKQGVAVVGGVAVPSRPPSARSLSMADEAEKPPTRWLPIALLATLGILFVVAMYQHFVPTAGNASAISSKAALGASSPATIEPQGTFTSQPASGLNSSGAERGRTLRERLQQRLAHRGRAKLTIISNDHDIHPDGGLKIFGQVRNTGGRPAIRARVRVRILREDGIVAARGETPLQPSTLPAGRTASFELSIDYAGPVATIRAELVWSD